MMFGLPPFYNKQQTTMYKLIKEAELKFPEKPAVSPEAKDFITKVKIIKVIIVKLNLFLDIVLNQR